MRRKQMVQRAKNMHVTTQKSLRGRRITIIDILEVMTDGGTFWNFLENC